MKSSGSARVPDPISAELVLAYEKTLFVILDASDLVLRIGELSAEADAFLAEHGATSAAIVSAWNPFSQALPAQENALRAAALKLEIDKTKLRSVHAEGRDPDGSWPSEDSRCVFNAAPALLDKWMRRFGQNAVVVIGVGQPARLVFHPGLRPAMETSFVVDTPAEEPALPTHSVYVIRLDPAVLEIKRFRSKNPNYIAGKPCVYVGMTGKSPDERFAQHKAGYKSNGYARRLGLYLSRRQFEHLNPMPYQECVQQEIELANRLRQKGWAVWQA